MVRHHDEGVQGDFISEVAGSLPFFDDELSGGAEVHPALLDDPKERHPFPRVRRNEVCASAVVVMIEAA